MLILINRLQEYPKLTRLVFSECTDRYALTKKMLKFSDLKTRFVLALKIKLKLNFVLDFKLNPSKSSSFQDRYP